MLECELKVTEEIYSMGDHLFIKIVTFMIDDEIIKKDIEIQDVEF